METLLEIIMEIVMEGTLYTAGNKKVSLWIRIPLILVLLLFFGFIQSFWYGQFAKPLTPHHAGTRRTGKYERTAGLAVTVSCERC